MQKKDDLLGRPENVRTTLEELELLASLADSNEFVIVERIARRFAELAKEMSFRLDQTEPNFSREHSRYYDQVSGMWMLIKFIKSARRKLAKAEDNG